MFSRTINQVTTMNRYGMSFCKLLIIFSLTIAQLKADEISGYYWRDYTGNIPYDAVPGGLENGRTTYVGQALFKELIVPAKIVPEEGVAQFEWGFKVFTTNQTVKVLCTGHSEYIHWYKSSTHAFERIKDKHFVVAGYEPGGTLYVGRQANNMNDVILGKLLFNRDGAVLHSAYHGESIMHWEFEALYFDPLSVSVSQPNKNTAIKNPTCKCKDKRVNVNLFC